MMNKTSYFTHYLLLIVISGHFSLQSSSQDLSAGLYHSFALCDDGIVKAFGRNDYGQLGIGNVENQFAPVDVTAIAGIVQVEAGSYFSMFRNASGEVWMAGSNGFGNFGNNTTSTINELPVLTNLADIIDMDAGNGHAVAVNSDGVVYAAGLNNQGQLGIASNNNSLVFAEVEAIQDIVDVEAGYMHTLFLKNDGTVWGCGSNNLGQLGMPFNNPGSTVPFEIPGLSNIVQISAGSYHSFFLDADGNVFATGSNPHGQLGNGNYDNQYGVVAITGLPPVTEVIAGNEHSFFLLANGDVYGVGFSNFGQNGLGETTNIPALLDEPMNVIEVAAWGDGNFGQSLFMTSTGEMWACGSNNLGALGTTGPSITSPTFITQMCGSFLPDANFTSDESEICLYPEACFNFENLSLDADSVHWYFGVENMSGSNAMDAVSACYTDPGTYEVTLTAWNEYGATNFSMFVVVLDYPDITFTSPDEYYCVDGSPVQLDAAIPDGGIYEGDGVAKGVFFPEIAGVGEHLITYYYTTGENCIATAEAIFEVIECTEPIASFEVSSSVVCIEDACIDISNFSLDADSVHWDLPGTDIELSNDASLAEICFNTPGSHTITLMVFNESGSDSYTLEILVYDIPEVSFVLEEDVLCVNFENTLNLSGGNPANGVYSGEAVTGEVFDGMSSGLGEFIVTYTYSLLGSCSGSASDTVFVEMCTGIEDHNFQNDVEITYGSDGSWIIRFNRIPDTDPFLSVYAADGKLLSRELITNNTIRIDTQSLANGLYFVGVTNMAYCSPVYLVR